MTQFQQKSFSVSQRGRDASACTHGWITPQGTCWYCGTDLAAWLHFPAIAAWLTPERREFVRSCRLGACSLRAVADATYEEFGGGPWSPPWNQLAGMDLCELAGVTDDSPEVIAAIEAAFPTDPEPSE